MNILVLTSRQNFVWHSMQEIIPFIEQTWSRFESEKHQVKILEIDNLHLKDVLPFALKADHIVLTCFNLKLIKIAAFIRNELQLAAGFVIHIHNMATIAFWPFRKWGTDRLFRKTDLFVSSCENDRRTVEQVFSNPNVCIVPFFLGHLPDRLKKSVSVSKFVYVGRISPQKNLHHLLLGYANALKIEPDLPSISFFGKEDDLGSPNMNFKGTGYQNFLNDLVKQLNLQKKVHFLGHTERSLITRYLSENSCTAISASLHSDENFGMAVLQALVTGNRALISDWGGHSDFKKSFNQQVSFLPVTMSELGPTLGAHEITKQLLNRDVVQTPGFFPDLGHYQMTEHLKILENHLLPSQTEVLQYSSLANRIFDRRVQYQSYTANDTQIFSDYHDPLFHEISAPYIGGSSSKEKAELFSEGTLVPWGRYLQSAFKISDPHKGEFIVENTGKEFDCTVRTDGQLVKCSTEAFKRLFTTGQLTEVN